MPVDPDVVKEAQAVFDHASGRSMRAYRLIASLLEFMHYGADAAREGFAVGAAQAVRELVARADFGPQEQREAALRAMPETAEGAADNTVADAIAAAEAASVVFMHSMLDAAVYDYCRVCASLDPTDWHSEVQSEKVTLAQARGDWDTLLRAAVERAIKRLKNESLPAKIDVLLAVCKPSGIQVLQGYGYDAARMKRIDLLRHKLVHEKIVKPPDDVIDDVEFMERTQVYLSALVTHRHGITLGADAMNPLLG